MKSMILLCLFAVASAVDFQMNLEENGEKFTEQIKINVADKTEEITVPQHQDRSAVDILNDFKVGLTAMKLPSSKRCLISKLDASEEAPEKMKESLELAHSRFPSERYMVETFKTLVVRKMKKEEVGVSIAAHCDGLDLFLAINFNKGNLEEEALKIVKTAKAAGRFRRDLQVNEFITCNYRSMNVVRDCPANKLGAKCTFFRNDQRVCAYKVTCQPNPSGGPGAATCRGDHRYNLLQCCDFFCI